MVNQNVIVLKINQVLDVKKTCARTSAKMEVSEYEAYLYNNITDMIDVKNFHIVKDFRINMWTIFRIGILIIIANLFFTSRSNLKIYFI